MAFSKTKRSAWGSTIINIFAILIVVVNNDRYPTLVAGFIIGWASAWICVGLLDLAELVLIPYLRKQYGGR